MSPPQSVFNRIIFSPLQIVNFFQIVNMFPSFTHI